MQVHHRRSIRLSGRDYSRPGVYFITIVTFQREQIFGEIHNGRMYLSLSGEIAVQEWFRTAKLRSYVDLYVDEFVVMPNHIHGIIRIQEQPPNAGVLDAEVPNVGVPNEGVPIVGVPNANVGVGVPNVGVGVPIVGVGVPIVGVGVQRRCTPTTTPTTTPTGNPAEKMVVAPRSLGAIVRAYKSAVTYAINGQKGTRSCPVWQSNYYERILHSKAELHHVKGYIKNNPADWAGDAENIFG